MALPFRPKDGLYLSDHFYSNDSVADAAIGELTWEIVTIGNASTYANLVTTNVTAGRYGVLRQTTAGTADGDGSVLRLDEDVLVLPGGKMISFSFAARYPNIAGNQLAGNNFRIGLQDSVTATSPTVGIWVDSDAGVLSLQADSGDHGDVSASVGGVSTLTSNTTMVLGTWHNFEVVISGTNANGGPQYAHLYVDGELGASLNNIVIDDDEEMELSIVHWQDTGGAATLELDIDYIDLLIQG